MRVPFSNFSISIFRQELSYVSRFVRGIGVGHFVLLQVVGVLVAITNVLGFASLFPLLTLAVGSKESFLQKYISPVVDISRLPTWLTAHPFYLIGLAILAVYTLKLTFQLVYAGYASYWLERFTARTRAEIVAAYVRNSELRLEREERSQILHLNNQLALLSSFNWGVVEVCLKIYIVIFAGIFIVGLSPKLAVGLFLLGLVIVALLYPVGRWTRLTMGKMFEDQQRVVSLVNSCVEGLDTIKTLNALGKQTRLLDSLGASLVRSTTVVGVARQLFFSMPEWIIVAVAILLVTQLQVTPDNFAFMAAYGYALVRFVSAVNELSSRYGLLLEGLKSPEAIYGYLGSTVAPLTTAAEHELQGKVSTLNFKDVSVVAGASELLSSVSVSIAVGGITQFIGPNGSGKSTLLKALLRLVPFHGEIEINGVSVRELSPASMAKQFAYHGQDNFLVPGTILENLLLENPGCSAERAIALSEELGAGLTAKFKGGYNHQILESGKNLSGGEKQIICLVRTLLRDAEIFVLDEFTNHLSSEIVHKVTRYLNSDRMAGRTLLIVTHQPIGINGQELRFERGRLVD